MICDFIWLIEFFTKFVWLRIGDFLYGLFIYSFLLFYRWLFWANLSCILHFSFWLHFQIIFLIILIVIWKLTFVILLILSFLAFLLLSRGITFLHLSGPSSFANYQILADRIFSNLLALHQASLDHPSNLFLLDLVDAILMVWWLRNDIIIICFVVRFQVFIWWVLLSFNEVFSLIAINQLFIYHSIFLIISFRCHLLRLHYRCQHLRIFLLFI